MRLRRTLPAILALFAAITIHSAVPQNTSARVMLEAAKKMELVDGDLNAAIQQYKEIVSKFKSDRSVVAEALVRMGESYKKQGDLQSRKIFEEVVNEYAEQTAAVAAARAHLGGTTASGDGATLRTVWSGPRVFAEGRVSPDGRYISYPAWDRGELGIRDLVTGTDRVLTTGSDNYAAGYAQASSFSPDSKQVSYSWFNEKNRRYELRLINLQSTSSVQSKALFDSPEVSYIVPSDWTPDGNWISAQFSRTDKTTQIGFVSVRDGSTRILKSIDWRGSTAVFLSPDGKHLAFDLPTSETDNNNRDVFVLSSDGSRQTQITEIPGYDGVMGWSPDGRYLLFVSDRSGQHALWGQSMKDGQPQGAAVLMRRGISGSALGVTNSGALFTLSRSSEGNDVNLASVDMNSGRLLTPSTVVAQSFLGSNGRPDWSPDGRYLAFVSVRNGNRVIVIHSNESGQVREVPVAMTYFGGIRWSPDGRSFALKGNDLKGREGVFRIDAQSGEIDLMALTPGTGGNNNPEWSPDGKKIYYTLGGMPGRAGSTFVERDLASGNERTVFRGAGASTSLSPDGRLIAAFDSNSVVLISVSTGERKELFRAKAPEFPEGGPPSWTPDGRNVIVHVASDKGWSVMIAPIDGGAPRKLELDQKVPRISFHPISRISVHPDGQRIAFGFRQNDAEVWALEKFLPTPSNRTR